MSTEIDAIRSAILDGAPGEEIGALPLPQAVRGALVKADEQEMFAGLASEETEENAIAHLSYDEGRHLTPVFAGDTLFAESTVVSKTEDDPRLSAFGKPGQAGVVKFLLRGKNQKGEVVLEITRELAILKREFRP